MEGRFKLNEYLRKPFKEKLKAKIDKVRSQAISLEQFKTDLEKVDVNVIIRQNSDGRIYGISYIDNFNKAIFNGSDLGKNYSAASIVEALQYKPTGNVSTAVDKASQRASVSEPTHTQLFTGYRKHGLLEELLNPIDLNTGPNQFGPKKKKKKRRNLNL